MTSREFKYIDAKRCRSRITNETSDGGVGVTTIKLSVYHQRRINAARAKYENLVVRSKPVFGYLLPHSGYYMIEGKYTEPPVVPPIEFYDKAVRNMNHIVSAAKPVLPLWGALECKPSLSVAKGGLGKFDGGVFRPMIDELGMYIVPDSPQRIGLMEVLMNPPVAPFPSPGEDSILDTMVSLMGLPRNPNPHPLLMSAEGLAIFDKAVKRMAENPAPRTAYTPPPVVEKKPIEIVDRYAEGPGTILTEDIITLLGFGEYWGESGEFGSRSLSDPENDQKYIMRIYDMDEMEAGSYGGYYQAETSPQHFCTSEFMQMNTLGELFVDAKRRYPKALPVLIENAKKTLLWYPDTSEGTSPVKYLWTLCFGGVDGKEVWDICSVAMAGFGEVGQYTKKDIVELRRIKKETPEPNFVGTPLEQQEQLIEYGKLIRSKLKIG